MSSKIVIKCLSFPTSSHAYGIGIIAVIVGTAMGLSYYQYFYLPELQAKPDVPEEILEPDETTTVNIVEGAFNENQQDDFVPGTINVQLGIDNHVIWKNQDQVAHTVTPDDPYEDSYSGKFGSEGVVHSGEEYEFLFTESAEIPYHCEPHPWMTGKVVITKAKF